MSPQDAVRYARQYANRGLAVLPIPAGQKNPALRSWQRLRIEPEEVAEHFNGRPQNVGILLGEPSGWLVDVDLDVPEAASAAPFLLPATLRSGRESAPRTHYWYHAEGARTEKFKDLDGVSLVELRSTGCQTLVEPSVHPEGDRYLWEEDRREIAEAAAEDLVRRCKLLATATIVARRLPSVGGRHDFALPLAGFLLRTGRLDEEEVLDVMEAAWSAAGGVSVEAERDLRGIARDTARNLGAGREVVGGRRLEELCPGLPRLLGRWWGWGSLRSARERVEYEGPARPSAERTPPEREPRASDVRESHASPPGSLPEAPPFPVDALPDGCQRFVLEGARAIGCPPDFLGMGALATLSVGIGASRVVQIKRSWREGASLFLAIVAPPGAKKTPAAQAAAEPVREHQARLQREYRKEKERVEREMRGWEVDKKLAYKDNAPAPKQPEKPDMGRVIADDTTVEALVSILEPNPRGLLADKDELTGWVRAMDQYKGGKGADRQHWLSIWSSKPVVVDRKSRAGEPIMLSRPWVSLFGGLQPTMLKELGGLQEDGLLDRFLFAYPPPKRALFSDAEISAEAEQEYGELYGKLAETQMVKDEYGEPNPGIVPMSEEAREAFRTRVDALAGEVYEPGFPSRMEGVWSKLEGYLARLSLILALARSKETGEIERVQLEDVEAAGRLIDYFKAHARRVYAEIHDATPQDVLTGELMDFLEEHDGEWAGSATELYEELKGRGAEGLPGNPEWLSKSVLAIGQHSPSLEAERGWRGKTRILRLALKSTVGTVGAVGGGVAGTYGADSTNSKFRELARETTVDHRPGTDSSRQVVEDPVESSGIAAAPEGLEELLADPPDWLRRQAEKHLEDPRERTLKALCASVAHEVLGNPRRSEEVRPAVVEALKGCRTQ